ncbi:MAG: TIGR02281 family clan AA aspartic protease [Rhizobiaceae bacterium]
MNRILYFVLGAIIISVVLLTLNHDRGTTFGLTNEKFASLVSLGLVAIYLGLNAFRPGAFGGAALRNIVIWLGVFVALIAGYQNRDTVQDLASSVTLGLVPASPQSSTQSDGTRVVTIGKSENGHFEVNADVNGASVRFLVDTGASSIALSTNDAQAIGIDMASLAYNVPISTANGEAMAANARIDEITIGTIIRRNMRVLVAKEGALNQSLLGMDFLNSLSSFTVKQDEMLLFE